MYVLAFFPAGKAAETWA